MEGKFPDGVIFQLIAKCKVLVVFALFIAIGQITPVPSVFAQNSNIEFIRTEAENARTFAAKQRNIAEKWKERAAYAFKQAEESRHKRDKEGWLADARLRFARASAAAIEADKAEALAVKAEAELAQAVRNLEQDPTNPRDLLPDTETASKTKNSDPAIPIKEIIGVWEIDELGSIFAIVHENAELANQAYKLESHSGSRVWKGWYTPFNKGHISRMQNARVVFKYSPKAEEMNPEIPQWARKKIEGQLEWEIELDEPLACGEPMLIGKFFPGEVKWNNDNKIVKIGGRGEPRKINLSRKFFEPEQAVAVSAIRIRPPGIGRLQEDGQYIAFSPVQFLVKGQLFYVDILLPYDVAVKTGTTLELEIAGIGDGGSETVTLDRGGFRKGAAVKYTNYRPLFFGKAVPILSERWVAEIKNKLLEQNPRRLDLGLANGESIKFVFDKTIQVTPVYKDIQSYTIAKYIETAHFLRKFYNARMLMPKINKVTKESNKFTKENAHFWIRKLKNFEILMNKADRPNWLKFMIAEKYIGPTWRLPMIMVYPDRHNFIARRTGSGTDEISTVYGTDGPLSDEERLGDNDKKGRFNGIVWVDRYEKTTVSSLINKAWRDRVKKAAGNLLENITFGLYEWVLSEAQIGIGWFGIGVSEVFALVSGTDHYGRKLTTDQKLDIVKSVALSNFLDTLNPKIGELGAGSLSGYSPPGDMLTISDVMGAVRGRSVQKYKVKLRKPGKQKNPGLPPSLSRKQKETAAPILSALRETIDSSTPLSCAPPRVQSDSSKSIGKALTIAKRYGEKALIEKHDAPGARAQEFATCQVEAIMNAAGIDINPIAVLRLMANNSPEFAKKLQSVNRENHPLVRGFNESEMELFAGLIGRETMLFPGGETVPMTALRNLRQRGWSIKVAINAKDVAGSGDNLHSVDIVGFKQDSDGCLRVTIHDKDIGAKISMPAEEFNSRRGEWPIMLHREQEGTSVPKEFKLSDDGLPPPKAKIKVSEFDDLPKKPIRAKEFDPFDDMTVGEAVNHFYPNGEGSPPINVVQREIQNLLLGGDDWQQPLHGGASFSEAGKLPGYSGDIAIRVKKKYAEKHIQWRKDKEGRGLIPRQWPEGKNPDGSWKGSFWAYIPREQLEYLDPSLPGAPEWRSYPPKGK